MVILKESRESGIKFDIVINDLTEFPVNMNTNGLYLLYIYI